MTFGRLLLRNLFYHWRGNLAVLLGVAVGTAVLTGALLVGASLRGSLRDRVLQQLGWVVHALVAGRFFREELAADPGKLGVERVAPALLLQGAASTAGPQRGASNSVRAAARPARSPKSGGSRRPSSRGGGKGGFRGERGGRGTAPPAPPAAPRRGGPGAARTKRPRVPRGRGRQNPPRPAAG